MAGAVLNALNIRLDAASIAFQLDHGGAKIILVDPEFRRRHQRSAGADEGPKTARHRRRRCGLRRAASGSANSNTRTRWRRAIEDFAARLPEDEWDAIALSYTSGTTGNPKGVVTHHRGAYLNAVSNILAGHARPASGLSLDAADVPLQRLVLSLDHRGFGRHQRLPAQGRSAKIFELIRTARRHPHVRRTDRLQHADQRAGCAERQAARPVVGLIAGAAPPVGRARRRREASASS